MTPEELAKIAQQKPFKDVLSALVTSLVPQILGWQGKAHNLPRGLTPEEEQQLQASAENRIQMATTPAVKAILTKLTSAGEDASRAIAVERDKLIDKLKEAIESTREQVVQDAAGFAPMKEHLRKRIARHENTVFSMVFVLAVAGLLACGLTIGTATFEQNWTSRLLLVVPLAAFLYWMALLATRVLLNSLHGIEDASHREAAMEAFIQMRSKKQLADQQGSHELLTLLLQPPASTLLKDAHKFPFAQIAEAIIKKNDSKPS